LIQRLLASTKGQIIVVDPTQIYQKDHVLWQQHVYQQGIDEKWLPKQAGFSSAATWERHYLERASDPSNGAIIFWCPLESKKEPRTDGHPYGLDTRSELGGEVVSQNENV
jgi:hypothetical protein